ncbi:uncharacterized protein ARMOST_06543 [Armillaria ostoyae]|uniref:Uncharacterized protein n=1 Tax=Armillaria ostoyae TaxID=47428 RepID=A0A284R3A2_ARMOS|nr:uncharacterized protein ARMOST_06543 [Armillaria ostoyae]
MNAADIDNLHFVNPSLEALRLSLQYRAFKLYHGTADFATVSPGIQTAFREVAEDIAENITQAMSSDERERLSPAAWDQMIKEHIRRKFNFHYKNGVLDRITSKKGGKEYFAQDRGSGNFIAVVE